MKKVAFALGGVALALTLSGCGQKEVSAPSTSPMTEKVERGMVKNLSASPEMSASEETNIKSMTVDDMKKAPTSDVILKDVDDSMSQIDKIQ